MLHPDGLHGRSAWPLGRSIATLAPFIFLAASILSPARISEAKLKLALPQVGGPKMSAFLARTSKGQSQARSSSSSSTKKRRGRPPKAVSTAASSTGGAGATATPNVQPRPRGRPRKRVCVSDSATTREKQLLYLALRGTSVGGLLGEREEESAESDKSMESYYAEEKATSRRSLAESTPVDLQSRSGEGRVERYDPWAPAPTRILDYGSPASSVVNPSESAEIEIKDANGSSEAAAENMHSRRRTGGFFQTLKRAVGAVGALFSPPDTKPNSPPPAERPVGPYYPHPPPPPITPPQMTPPPCGVLERNPHSVPFNRRPTAPPPSQVPSPSSPRTNGMANCRRGTGGETPGPGEECLHVDSPVPCSPRPA